MMNLFTSKSLMSRLCLMSIILMCSLLSSENAFSIPWKEAFREAIYNKKDESITIKVQSYFHNYDYKTVYNYLNELNIAYSEDGIVFTPLLSAGTDFQGVEDKISVKIKSMKIGEKIEFPSGIITYKAPFQLVTLNMLKLKYKDDSKQIAKARYAVLAVKWKLLKSTKSVKFIKLTGKWYESVLGKVNSITFSESLDLVKSTQKASVESKNNVKIARDADLINVTGVKYGENIKVYNPVSGLVVKSVIAHDDVVTIRLKKSQSYIIQVGATCTKL